MAAKKRKRDDDEEVFRGLRRLRKCWPSQFAVLDGFHRATLLHMQYSAKEIFDVLPRDTDLANLVGLLYIHQCEEPGIGHLITCKEAERLCQTACEVLKGNVAVAQSFLHSSTYASTRDCIRKIIHSDCFRAFKEEDEHSIKECVNKLEYKVEDDHKAKELTCEELKNREHELKKLSRKVYKLVRRRRSQPFSCPKLRYDVNEDFGKLTKEELQVLLRGIKEFTIVKALVVPLRTPFMAHLHKVQDGVENARLLLLGVPGNIFSGCNFTYADLRSAIAQDASRGALEKLDRSSRFLAWLVQHPGYVDKLFRERVLVITLSDERESLLVLNSDDFPAHVPADSVWEEKDLRVLRTYPWASSEVRDKSDLARAVMDDASCQFFVAETRELRERLQLNKVLERMAVSASPNEVYNALIQYTG